MVCQSLLQLRIIAKDKTGMKYLYMYFHGWIHRLFQIKVFILFPFVFNRLSEVAPYLRGGVLQQRVALDGNRLELTCLAGGSWPLQYRWTLNHSYITDWTPQYRSVTTGYLRSPLSAWVFIWLTLMNPVSILSYFFLLLLLKQLKHYNTFWCESCTKR